MIWRFDKSKVEDTFKGVDSDINREELRRMADEEGIQIDWSYWDEILQNQSVFEEEEEETDSTSREPNKNKETQPKYVYTTDGKFIKSFNTTRECAEYFEIAPETVCQYARDEKPYFKLGIIIMKFNIYLCLTVNITVQNLMDFEILKFVKRNIHRTGIIEFDLSCTKHKVIIVGQIIFLSLTILYQCGESYLEKV